MPLLLYDELAKQSDIIDFREYNSHTLVLRNILHAICRSILETLDCNYCRSGATVLFVQLTVYSKWRLTQCCAGDMPHVSSARVTRTCEGVTSRMHYAVR